MDVCMTRNFPGLANLTDKIFLYIEDFQSQFK